MRNRMYGGVRGRKMKVGGKLLHFPPTRFYWNKKVYGVISLLFFNCALCIVNCALLQ